MRILVVDDSRAMRLLVVHALKSLCLTEVTYLEAGSGPEAEKLIEDGNADLVISDFDIPGMNGVDLLRALREKGMATPFGFLTSEASARFHQEASAAGACFLVTKPFTASTLCHALAPVLSLLGISSVTTEASPETRLSDPGAHFPTRAQVAAFFTELLRRKVTASPARPVAQPSRKNQIVVDYGGADDAVASVCGIFDLTCAVLLGAALGLIPRGVAAEALESKRLEGAIAENFNEVADVMSRVFDRGCNARFCRKHVYLPGTAMTPQLADRIFRAVVRIESCLEISGYGKGDLALLSLP